MVMNVEKLQKETERYRSQWVLHNVEAIFNQYIIVAMKQGEGEIKLTAYQLNELIGKKIIEKEELQYFEALGYDIFCLKCKNDFEVKYIIAWSVKDKRKNHEQVQRDIFSCKKEKNFFTGKVLAYIAYVIASYICISINSKLGLMMLAFGIIFLALFIGIHENEPFFRTSKYLYVTPK